MEELSYIIRAGQIKDQPQKYHLKANDAQCAALAKRFGLKTITKLEGLFRLQHERSGIISAALSMSAEVAQICVVTLDPFPEQITEQTTLRFVPLSLLQRQDSENDEEEDITPESLDSPDEIPYENDQIDLGAALAEQLALTLDPYPRKPDAAMPEAASDHSAHPFAALASKLNKKPQ